MREKKIKMMVFVGVVILALAGTFLLWPRRCSDEKLRALRECYPASYGKDAHPLVDLAPASSLEDYAARAESYVYVSVLDETDESGKELEDGFSKAGQESAAFRNFKVTVKKVAFGDRKLKDREILLTVNRKLPVPRMERGIELILPVAKGEDGSYNMGPGVYYVADGYVLSFFEEQESSAYSGMKVGSFLRKLQNMQLRKFFQKAQ